MWKYLAALLVVLLSMGGLVSAVNECTDCYANIISQSDTQTIDTVRLGQVNFVDDENDGVKMTVAVGNEGLSAGIIVTQAPPVLDPATGTMFVQAPFARIDQKMDQRVSNLGSEDLADGLGAKGITWNKAIQAAWIANQGVKELEDGVYQKEGSWISQTTNQTINNVYDYQERENAKVLNVDNKLAMIVDDINRVLNLTATANSASTDSQASNGTIIDGVEVTIAGSDPEHL